MTENTTVTHSSKGEGSPLVFLHLSDIHFKIRSGGHYDLDEDLRNELEQDVARMRPHLPAPVAAVIVSGDIAFSGQPKEYEVAKRWLDTLCQKVGCDTQDVLIVPGNHDVDRSAAKGGLNDFLRRELRNCDVREIDVNLQQYLPKNDALFQSIAHFNDFAARYECNISPERIFWERTFQLSDKSGLRIRGATTTLVSDANDHRETGKLVMGTHQAQLRSQPGVANVVVAHHPPEWLRDEDTIRDFFNNRSILQLYGHKHNQRAYRIDDSVVVSAGAVHPARDEWSWEPRYNFISLDVDSSISRELVVNVFPRVWKQAATCFKEDEHLQERIALPPWSPVMEQDAGSTEILKDSPSELDEPPNYRDSYRRLVWGFHSPEIGFATKLNILNGLELLEDEDEAAGTLEVYERAFIRAAERRKLGRLWQITDSKLDGRLGTNPFEEEG